MLLNTIITVVKLIGAQFFNSFSTNLLTRVHWVRIQYYLGLSLKIVTLHYIFQLQKKKKKKNLGMWWKNYFTTHNTHHIPRFFLWLVIPNYNKCFKLTFTQKIREPLNMHVSACKVHAKRLVYLTNLWFCLCKKDLKLHGTFLYQKDQIISLML